MIVWSSGLPSWWSRPKAEWEGKKRKEVRDMENLYFEELEKVEELSDAKDYGAAFGVSFCVAIIVYVGYATLT